MKIVAFLPAKGTSERIESKNMKLLNGKPLFLYTLEKLVSCEFIDEVYLDSESDEILNYADYLNYKSLKRDIALANNKTDGHQMFMNEVRQVDADIYIQILCTSPFISKDTIKRGINILIEHKEYDSVVLMKKEKQYLWSNNQPLYDKYHIPNSKDLPDTLIESMGLYIVRKEIALRTNMRYGDNVYILTADAIETVDVNYPDEFELADYIMKGIKEKESQQFALYTRFFNSSVFSDILEEMGIHSSITGFIINNPNKCLMGRANTLKIRRLNDGEDYRGIYKGLDTYEKIVPGEIIIVDNEVGERAYFGEMNAHLAIHAGAIGTIVNGVTRDIQEVNKIDYTVLSKGYCCADVKGIATVEAHQVPLCIQGVYIEPGDIIFADINGVVVIPKKLEEEVIKRAIETANTEKNILIDVLNHEKAQDIFKKEGEF